jgi:uncharacterized protein YjbI with pentapeptide repeats
MSKLIELKNRDTGKVVFSSTNEGNTIAKCLRLAKILCKDVRNIDLSGADLSHGHFVELDLTGSDLRGAILDGANFYKAILDKVNISSNVFQKTLVRGVNFQGALMNRVYAEGTNFTGSYFIDVISQEGNFNNCILDRANLTNFITRGTTFKNVSTKDAVVDKIDTRIEYRRSYIPPVNVCAGEECQQCAGCKSEKKLVNYGNC